MFQGAGGGWPEQEMRQYQTLNEFAKMVCKDVPGPRPYPTHILQRPSRSRLLHRPTSPSGSSPPLSVVRCPRFLRDLLTDRLSDCSLLVLHRPFLHYVGHISMGRRYICQCRDTMSPVPSTLSSTSTGMIKVKIASHGTSLGLLRANQATLDFLIMEQTMFAFAQA